MNAQVAMATDEYVARDGDVGGDRDTVLSIWRGNLGEQAHMRAKYDWFYLRCPFGEPVLQLLHHVPSREVAGTCAAGQRRMLWNGAPLQAGVMVDLAVISGHRSLGPALLMQRALIEASLQRFGFVYGFPNAKAVAIFRRLGARKLVDIVRHARVLRPVHYLRRRVPAALAVPLGFALELGMRLRDGLARIGKPRLEAGWTDRVDARMDALWARSQPESGLFAVRDTERLRWRFDEAPAGRTRYLLLARRGERDLQAWFATQIEDGILHVRDFWSTNAAEGIPLTALDALLAAARRLPVVAVSVEFACHPRMLVNWHRRGFVERSRRPVYAFWRDDHGPDDGSRPLLLTSADEDE